MALVFRPPQRRLLLSGNLKIDPTHPLANGLVGCYVPGLSRGINLVGGIGGDLALLTAANNWDSTQEGQSFKTSTSADGLQGLAPAAFLNNTGTLYWRGWYTGGSDNGASLIGFQYNNVGGSPFLYLDIGIQFSAPNLLITQWNSGGSFANGSAAFTLTQNSFLSCGATFKPGGNAIGYVSGAAYNTTAFGASNPTSSATTTICLHSNTADLTRPMHASCNIACIWNRDLSADEMALIDADPYGFLMPAEGEMPALQNPVVLATGSSFGAPYVGRIFPYRSRRQIPA